LSCRCQFVQIQDDRSDAQFIRLGVPQSSILALLLVLVYINDIFDLDLRGQLQLYVDDVVGRRNYGQQERLIPNVR
jgi:hypothetical protein